jgi:hypothetical protein
MKKQIVIAAVIFACAANVHALTNEEFAKEVQRHMGTLEKDKKALRDAEQFCSMLSPGRRSNEPRCIAAERVSFAQTTGPNSARIK